ncbi:hypothetical protein V9T40_008386 [Parthenolecanium corni]|uniref:Fatty acyl-CoA reductase n=1 Tax=Parthenolecanium corni TaxID=536013 RepID=A0AAN9TKS9_9HEMI
MEEKPEIPEFYRGRTVLLTGCTGFIGKVLIWKLLYSCPLIKNIYILLRKKHGKDVSERKDELFSCPIFDNFRKSNPHVFDKVVAIEGDVGEENIGISKEDKITILNDVSIVFHNAALLKMDATLSQAININTKGVIRMLDIAKEMKNLDAFLYVSTAYSCCNEMEVEEKLYSIPGDPYDVIHSVDWLPAHVLERITMDIIAPLPNTYTFSKRLTELLLKKYEDQLSIIVARPTIVLSSAREPFPGWIDNLNGAGGVAITTGKGILHSMPAHRNKKGDLVPVDIVCNSLIAIPWGEAKKKELDSMDVEIPVYNLALAESDPITWGDFQKVCTSAALAYPYETILWYPTYDVIQENMLVHHLEVIFYHTIPAYVVDFLLYLLGKKTFMVRTQRKISQGLKVLRYFSTQQWNFRTDNIIKLKSLMNDKDKDIFPITEKGLSFDSIIEQSAIASKKYYFKEDLDNIQWCKTKLKIFYAIKVVSKVFLYYLLLKVLLKIGGLVLYIFFS